MSLYDRINEAVAAMVAAYKEAYADQKLTFSEVVALVMLFVKKCIDLVAQISGYSAAERKEAILAAVETLIDDVITPIDLKPVPNWLEPVVDRGLKTVIMEIARGAVDALVDILDKLGEFGPLPVPVPQPNIDDGQILMLCKMPEDD